MYIIIVDDNVVIFELLKHRGVVDVTKVHNYNTIVAAMTILNLNKLILIAG